MGCLIYGHWALELESWPDFPVFPMMPITISSDGPNYRLTSRIDNYFTTSLTPSLDTECSSTIDSTKIISTAILGPRQYAERLWTSMLENMKRIKVLPDGKLHIWFTEDYKWNRISFIRTMP
eukprot:Protomagalhaensia_wolfi_Nauph_80__877@NODE_1505_length_1496_cov_29_474262_g1165_i0_p2_GENE_NODE_1505_length_1496_cov_29_474262_g1165_i0NODE_1505_length_1496_cov_29_474262_g1165_i0_p2_ORF_typecomplete_len122_score9_58_NODE_1505_length_1496_cov_29_474262_g1165_i07361101